VWVQDTGAVLDGRLVGAQRVLPNIEGHRGLEQTVAGIEFEDTSIDKDVQVMVGGGGGRGELGPVRE
jgi:hypothetical protein